MAADLAVFPELWTASAIREFPEPAAQLVLNGAEIIVVPNACQWDEIRTAGLKTRAFENLVGVAMANYPAPRIA
jgi:predicted amidohydrolase